MSIRKDGKPLWSKHPSADVAAMLITLPEGADVPDVPVDVLATDEMLTQSAVHPGDTASVFGVSAPVRGEPVRLCRPAQRNDQQLSALADEGDQDFPAQLQRV